MQQKDGHTGHKAIRFLLAAFCAFAVIPVFGVGIYRNGSGQVFFDLWYLMGFMVVAFFLMHELITPLPAKKEEPSSGKKSGRMGAGRPASLFESPSH
jgi:hypothetical protein